MQPTNTAQSINGEIRPGDWVIAAPNNDYGSLVGQVTAIDKIGTPDHGTDNSGDDIHVNFTAREYSKQMQSDILAHFDNQGSTVIHFDDLPLDDVLMAPDMLINITGLGLEQISRFTESYDVGDAYCKQLIDNIDYAVRHNKFAEQLEAVPETPAEKARQRLINRAQQNWDDFRNTPLTATSENIYHKAATVIGCRDAFIFIKDYGGFTAAQVNCLLQFADPVDLVAGYLDPKSSIEEMPGILASIRDDLENLKQHYALAADTSTPSFEELEQRLRGRLEENYGVYKRDMLDAGKEELFKSAPEIAAVTEIYEYMTQEHAYKETEVDFLLKFKKPLELLSDGRNAGLYDVRDTVDWVCADQERTLSKGGYELMPDETDPMPDAPAQQRTGAETGEKQSVMERIRQAAKDARERPAMPKDAPERKKTGPEL
jgi:hypothetical protein